MKGNTRRRAAWAALRKTSRRWLGGASLGIPNLEASNVELKGSSAGRPGGPFHHQLILRKDRVAGIAGFPGARTAPDLCDAVVWQAPVSDLALDEKTESIVVHVCLSGGVRNTPDSPCTRPQRVNPRGAVQAAGA